MPVFRDALMGASLLRLSTKTEGRQVSEDIGDEIAARQIVIRLCVAVGGRLPDWQKDTSVFTPFVMRQIVERMDETIGVYVSLETMARNVSLSPGHFARKFHQSTGLSLNRFMNRRRIGISFAMLRKGASPLSSIALDLGFSSQSHFTSLFSRLTGISPQRFRRLHLQMGE
jgi:AraC family transcriptional regulator